MTPYYLITLLAILVCGLGLAALCVNAWPVKRPRPNVRKPF